MFTSSVTFLIDVLQLLTFHLLSVRVDLEKQPTKQLEMLQHVHSNSRMSWQNEMASFRLLICFVNVKVNYGKKRPIFLSRLGTGFICHPSFSNVTVSSFYSRENDKINMYHHQGYLFST